jgi:Mlc titration factor MtfA (ptsG expression regulator)
MISTDEIYTVLLFEFPYFKKINEEKRQQLCLRTKRFIEETNFIPRKGIELTNRMVILISACSQQLTLGFLNHYNYTYFEKIIVYPEKYLSTVTEKYHTGEMNTAGIVVLSWEDFYKGIKIDNDAHNVGLHEFAHALEFMDIANKDVNEVFSACLDKFTVLADQYLQHQPDKPLFRSYATTNLSEFFAVATEYYFEAPYEFAQQEPELFDVLHKAYQQDTAPKASKPKLLAFPRPEEKDLLFGHATSFAYSLMELFVYSVIVALAGFTTLLHPVTGILILLTASVLVYRFAFKNHFCLYLNQVQIYKPYIKRLIDVVFYNTPMQEIYVDYSHVLYVSADEYYSDQLNDNFERQLTGLKYTLCYWENGRVSYANFSTTSTNYDELFLFLYRKKKVGTRINGTFKKYRISK